MEKQSTFSLTFLFAPIVVGPPLDWQNGNQSARHLWFSTLHILNTDLALGLNFSSWPAHKRPLLGLYPKNKDVVRTNYTVTYLDLVESS